MTVASMTPLLTKYLQQWENNPHSRVFAPLAECYRKMGNVNEAIKILRRGINHHPQYVFGYLILASCYQDQRKFNEAYQILGPFALKNLDNYLLQEVFAQICMNLGKEHEALQCYKYLLFLRPRDVRFQNHVRKLEEALKLSAVSNEAPSHMTGSISEEALRWQTFSPAPVKLSVVRGQKEGEELRRQLTQKYQYFLYLVKQRAKQQLAA